MKNPRHAKASILAEGDLSVHTAGQAGGFGHVPRPRHNIFENKFSRVDSLATRHRRLSPYRARIHVSRQFKNPAISEAFKLAEEEGFEPSRQIAPA